jgi:hypothetical protein
MGEFWDNNFCELDIWIDFFLLIIYNLLLKLSFNLYVHMFVLILTIADLQYMYNIYTHTLYTQI